MRLKAFLRPLVYLSLAGLAACGSNPPSQPPAASEATPTAASAAPPAPIRIGLALGGGAVKGFAHIGVIKMLEANGFTPAVVAGTSAGSVVGALYASGMNAFDLQEKAVALDETKIRDLQLSSGGLLVGQKLEDYVNEQVGRKPMEQLAKPFVAVSTRLVLHGLSTEMLHCLLMKVASGDMPLPARELARMREAARSQGTGTATV
jgi:NTE family protein